jgi:hypothetical protein
MDAGFVGRGQARDRATVWGHPDSIRAHRETESRMSTAARIVVSTTPVALNTASSTGQRLQIKNTTANAADLGPSTVAAGAGFDLAGNATVKITLQPGDVLYAIRSGGTNTTLAVAQT